MITHEHFQQILNIFKRPTTLDFAIQIYTGKLDKELYVYAFFSEHKRLPENLDEFDNKPIQRIVQIIKEDFRNKVDTYLAGKLKDKVNKHTFSNDFLLKSISKESELGSIKDIATKLSLSISYIRSLKKDNILEVCYEIFDRISNKHSSVFSFEESNLFDVTNLLKNN